MDHDRDPHAASVLHNGNLPGIAATGVKAGDIRHCSESSPHIAVYERGHFVMRRGCGKPRPLGSCSAHDCSRIQEHRRLEEKRKHYHDRREKNSRFDSCLTVLARKSRIPFPKPHLRTP